MPKKAKPSAALTRKPAAKPLSGSKKAPGKAPGKAGGKPRGKPGGKSVGKAVIDTILKVAGKPPAPKAKRAAAAPTDVPRALERQAPVDATVLDRLAATVLSRRTADPAVSHSARLLARGTAKVAQKFGEEAVECLIEAVAGHHDALVAESADVLYHLVVLWVDAGVAPADVWEELHRREGISGIAEKARRKIALPTTKIP